MGACYERCYKKLQISELEFIRLFQQQKLCVTGFQELMHRIVNASESITQKDRVRNLIPKERYLAILAEYFNEEDKISMGTLFEGIADAQVKSRRHLTTEWALFSVLPFSCNSCEEKVNYFLRIMLIPYKDQLLNEEVIISSETSCNVCLIQSRLNEYLRLHIVTAFTAFGACLAESKNEEMKKSVEYLNTKVFTVSNVNHYVDKLLSISSFPKKMSSQVAFDDVKNFVLSIKHILMYNELRLRFFNEYDY